MNNDIIGSITIGQFSEIPSRTRRGGGGGRKSPLLDALRNSLNENGTVARLSISELNREGLFDIRENESVADATQRLAGRFYRPDAFNFEKTIRTYPEEGIVEIYRKSWKFI